MAQLTDDEIVILKELADNLLASRRLSRVFKSGLLWVASVLGAGYVVWNFIIKGHIQ